MLDRLLRRGREQGRTDDTEQTIRTRLAVYSEQTAPLIDTYRKRGLLAEVEGLGNTFLMHLGGKIEVTPKVELKHRDDLSRAYTPGVARVCLAIAENPADARHLTIKRNTVTVVTDGSAVVQKSCYLAYLARPEVSPRAMSENIALDLFGSHNTAEPTGVDAPVLETGMVSVSPFPLEIRCIAQANASASGSDVSRPSLIASATAMLNFQ